MKSSEDRELDKLISEVKRKREEYHTKREKERKEAMLRELTALYGMDVVADLEEKLVKELSEDITKNIIDEAFKLGKNK